ncbi:MAG: hypothetical protein QOK37_3391 [Thermoanaerobaculia bacterium]|jgi:hypothetical protein|nr:hypothetical protein [Thermoanaerobaculia bacterium]
MRHRWAFAAITLLSLAVFAPPLFRNEVFSIRDHSDYFQPLRWFTANELRHGRLPLWNAYSASGEPWLANPQTGVFYPPTWLFVVLPFSTAYTLFLWLHALLLGCGGYLLFARLTRPGGAALAAALALTFCGPVISLLDVSNNFTTFAWIPLILWCALTDVSATMSAAAIAMSFLAGEPFFAAIGALLFAVMRRRGARDLIDVALTSIGLSAIQLLPFLATVVTSNRGSGGLPRSQLLHDSMPLRDWLRIAVPPNLGPNAFDLRIGQHFIPIIYLGALTVGFALIGAFIGRRRALGWIVVIVLCVVIGAGSGIAPVGEALARLPITLFRYPARVVPFAALAICALAAIGIDRLIGGRWQFAIALLMFADVAYQVQPLLVTGKFDMHRVPYPPGFGRDAKILRVDTPSGYDRLGWIGGYLNLYGGRFDAWTASPVVSQRYSAYYESLVADHKFAGLDALSAGYILAPAALRGFPAVTVVRGAVVHLNRSAFPLAYFRDGISGRIADVQSLAFTSSAVFIDVEAAADGDVVVTQQAAPGWDVAVDAKPANPHEPSLFRSVHVARGRHSIKWTYRPVPLFIGACITLVALLRLLLSRWFVKRRQYKKNLLASSKNA